MNWLQYYEAVKRGDVETVKRATDKDCTIPLSMNKNAIEIAALHGNQKLVEYFLDVAEGERRKRGRCYEALEESLRGGHYELSKYLSTRSGLDAEEPRERGKNRTLIEAAIEGKNLECLEMMWRYSSAYENRWDFATHAFSTGSREMINSVHEISVPLLQKLSDAWLDETCRGTNLPHIYIYLALGRFKKGMKYVRGDMPMKHLISCRDRRSLEEFTLLDAAGFFGDLDILKLQIEELNESKECIESQLQSVVKFAHRNNHIKVVKYLVENRIVVPRPPYEYEGFNINETFEYLRDIDSNTVVDDIPERFLKNIKERLRVLPSFGGPVCVLRGSGDTTISRILEDRSAAIKIEEYYDYLLDACCSKISELDIGGFFMEALSEQNVDAALCFRKRVSKVGCHSTRYHEHFENAIAARDANFDIITSPVVAELLLSTLNGALTCSCLMRLDPFRKFLRGPYWNEEVLRPGQPYPECAPSANFRMETFAQHTLLVLEVLFSYGIPKPDSKTVIKFMKELFAWKQFSSATAGKLHCLLECCKVNLDEINITVISPWWFAEDWTGRNEVLTYFLVALSRNARKGRVAVDYMLMYIFDSPKLKNHYFSVFKKIGLLVDDAQFGQPISSGRQYVRKDEIRAFNTALAECQDRVPSLQEIARSEINFLLMDAADRSPCYVSVQTLIDRVAQDLPKDVQKYLKFEDVYRTVPHEGWRPYRSEELRRIACDSDQHPQFMQNNFP